MTGRYSKIKQTRSPISWTISSWRGFSRGKDVKITGRLDSDSNTIYISDIGLLNAKRSA